MCQKSLATRSAPNPECLYGLRATDPGQLKSAGVVKITAAATSAGRAGSSAPLQSRSRLEYQAAWKSASGRAGEREPFSQVTIGPKNRGRSISVDDWRHRNCSSHCCFCYDTPNSYIAINLLQSSLPYLRQLVKFFRFALLYSRQSPSAVQRDWQRYERG